MTEPGKRGGGTLAIFGIAVVLNLVLTLMVLDQLTRSRSEIRELSSELATKQDIAMFRPLRVGRILEENCTGCHTTRRFAATSSMEERQIASTVARMSSHSGGNIPAVEFAEIAAALLVRRCTACHSEAVLSRLLLYPEEHRMPFLRKKVAAPGSGFRSDQVEELTRAIQLLAGEAW